jgi:hypothetical protein
LVVINELLNLPIYVLSGFVFAFLYAKTGKISSSMMAHCYNNLYSYITILDHQLSPMIKLLQILPSRSAWFPPLLLCGCTRAEAWKRKLWGLNSFWLKVIGCLLMTMDHIAPSFRVLGSLGKQLYPVLCFTGGGKDGFSDLSPFLLWKASITRMTSRSICSA